MRRTASRRARFSADSGRMLPGGRGGVGPQTLHAVKCQSCAKHGCSTRRIWHRWRYQVRFRRRVEALDTGRCGNFSRRVSALILGATSCQCRRKLPLVSCLWCYARWRRFDAEGPRRHPSLRSRGARGHEVQVLGLVRVHHRPTGSRTHECQSAFVEEKAAMTSVLKSRRSSPEGLHLPRGTIQSAPARHRLQMSIRGRFANACF